MQALRNVVVTLLLGCAISMGLCRPAAADTGYLALVGSNPANAPCPATVNFTGHIDGPPGSAVTFNFAHFVAGMWTYTRPGTAWIPSSGSLSIATSLALDSAHQGVQSNEIRISSPAGSDTATHGRVSFTFNCAQLQAFVPSPQAARLVTLIPLRASLAYFNDHTGFNPLCIPWPLPHRQVVQTDFGGAVAAGFTHYQHGGPNGDPCGFHSDNIYRIMLDGNVPPVHGHLSTVVLTAAGAGVDSNVGNCKLDVLSGVGGSFNTGDVHDASGFSRPSLLSWVTSGPDPARVNFQIYPIAGVGYAESTLNAALGAQYAAGYHIELMLKGPNESITGDNLRCLLKYTNFNLNVIAG